jgi:hypothetical protein
LKYVLWVKLLCVLRTDSCDFVNKVHCLNVQWSIYKCQLCLTDWWCPGCHGQVPDLLTSIIFIASQFRTRRPKSRWRHCCWRLLAEMLDSEQLAGSNILLCQQRLSGLMSKGWALRAKASHLIYLASRLQKQKARSNPYMVIFNFISYFTLVLCDFSLLQCYLTFLMFRFLDFIFLLCHPYLPAIFSGLRSSLLSFYAPPCYSKII